MVVYLIGFIVSAGGAWAVCRWGDRWGLSDCPTERSSHCTPTPKGGGVGILIAFTLLAILLKVPYFAWSGGLLVGLVGLWDDHRDLSPSFRLTIQFVAATVLSYAFSHSGTVPGEGWLLMIPAAFFIVATTNFYNFMDGIDGLAGLTGCIGFLLVALLAHKIGVVQGNGWVTVAVCISFACLGFLVFNFPVAKVFMGDVGSIFLGFWFAVTVIILSKSFLDFLCLAACIFPFYADGLLTLLIRIRDGEDLRQPHRRHLYQLLVNELQLEHWKVSLGYAVFQVVAALCVFFLRSDGYYAVGSAIVLMFCVFSSVSLLLRRRWYRFSNNA